MIELDIEAPDVLRRVLEDLDSRIEGLDKARAMNKLPDGATNDEIILKINEIILNFNLILSKEMI